LQSHATLCHILFRACRCRRLPTPASQNLSQNQTIQWLVPPSSLPPATFSYGDCRVRMHSECKDSYSSASVDFNKTRLREALLLTYFESLAIERPRTRSTAACHVSNAHERDLVTNQNVLIRDKISFVGVAHVTRGGRSCCTLSLIPSCSRTVSEKELSKRYVLPKKGLN